MNYQNLPNVPLTTSTSQNGHNKKPINNHERTKPQSSPYMTTPIQPVDKKRKTTEVHKQSYEDTMMRELDEDYSHFSNSKITKFHTRPKTDHRKPYQNQVQPQHFNRQNIAHIETQPIYKNLNHYTLDERNTYGEEAYFQNNHNYRKMSQEPQIHHNEPQAFQYIHQTETLEDFEEDESDQEQQFSRNKSVNNLRALNQVMMVKKNSVYVEKDKRNNHERIYQMDQFQQKAILQNFRVSDLHFLNDQQLLPQNMLAQRLEHKNSIKHSAKNSGKTESNHAIFRDTIEYVDNKKFDEGVRHFNPNSQSHQISDYSSMSSSPLTNVGEGYRAKYRKYKEKYMNMADVVKQFELLNETLIKDQREHFRYYEDTIKHLESMLIMKDKEIEEFNHLLNLSRVSERHTSRGLCSIDSRQLEIENKKLKKEVEAMSQQIQALKQSLKTLDDSYHTTEKTKETTSKSVEKKMQMIRKENETLAKRIKSTQDLIKTYEQKMKDKEERVNKLSEMNSELQEEILKLKHKLRLEQTYDTEREYRISFAPKIYKQHFINATSSKGQNANRTSLQSSVAEVKPNPQIQKYLACIDNQLQLIRSHMTSKEHGSQSRQWQRNKKQVSNVLNSVDEFEVEESSQDQRQDNPSLNDLISVVDRLASFRVSMGV